MKCSRHKWGTEMQRTQTEAWPSVIALSPVWTCPFSAPPGTKSTGCAQLMVVKETLLVLWALRCSCGDDMSQLSADDIKPASTHPLPVLHMSFLPLTVYFKRYNTLASCPCFWFLHCKILSIINNMDSVKVSLSNVTTLLTAKRNMNANLGCRERCSRLTSTGF